MITVTFSADSIEQLREQMFQLLNGPDGYDQPMLPGIIPSRPKAGRKKGVVVPPVVSEEDTPSLEEVRASPEPSPAEDEEKVNVPALVNGPALTFDTKELLELKERVINELNARYRKGHVDGVKDFLDRYGKGAKSFRQIDINDFPAMDAALKAGALGE